MNFPKFYNKIFDYSLKKGTHFKFMDILKNRTIKENNINILSQHIYKELPIRLANRVTDLNNLPFGLSKNHSINKIREWYLTSFLELIEAKDPNNNEDLNKFKNIIHNIYERHSPTLITMSKGILELKKENKISDIEAPQIQTFLNRFYTNRTEIRILLEQYLSLFEKSHHKDYFGIVNLKSNPYEILYDVINHLENICNENLNDIIKIHCNKKIEMPSLDHYLYYILFEIIKNSIQAIRDKKELLDKNYIPFVNIYLHEIDDKWILIKIEDNGIGIKSSDMNKIWYYSFSTSQINSNEIIETSDFYIKSPLSGFGYGLPISDIYINFLNPCNSNINIESIFKKGTTIYLYLRNYNSLFVK